MGELHVERLHAGAPQAAGSEETLARITGLVGHRLIAVEKEFESYLESDIPLIARIGRYISESGGKRIRPALLLLTSQLGDHRGNGDVLFASVFELIHTATLVHDDVIDEASVRRGRLSVNRRWGNHVTVLLGDYLYIKSMQMALTAHDLRYIQILADITLKMIEGELVQAERNGRLEVTEEEYLDLIRRKTAYLFSGCCRVGGLLAGLSDENVDALTNYGLHLGMAFQIVDDILDLTGSEESLGKPVASDLREGKVTLPVIHLLEKADPALRRKVEMILEDGTFERVAWSEIVDGLTRVGALERARLCAREYAHQAAGFLKDFPASPAGECLQDLPRFVVERQR
jgi:octaprenyl-diphosphate synthase